MATTFPAARYGIAAVFFLGMAAQAQDEAAAPPENPFVWWDIAAKLEYPAVPMQGDSAAAMLRAMIRHATGKGLDVGREDEWARQNYDSGNWNEALRRYRRLGRFGFKQAQYMVGLILIQGKRGVDQDLPGGLAWLWLADENGGLKADQRNRIVEVWEKLDRRQRELARQRLYELLPEYSNIAVLRRMKNFLRSQLGQSARFRLRPDSDDSDGGIAREFEVVSETLRKSGVSEHELKDPARD